MPALPETGEEAVTVMGMLARLLSYLSAPTLPAPPLATRAAGRNGSPQPVAALSPAWAGGVGATLPDIDPVRVAREGYARNEIVYAAVEERVTSVAKARLRVAVRTPTGPEVDAEHPAQFLLDEPNPTLSRFDLLATIELWLCLAGNAYIEKVRDRRGQVVELWPIRPDRVRVLPAPDGRVQGYRVQVGGATVELPARDVIHFRARHPYNDYYGMPPLLPAAERVDIDVWMRQFISAFFRNAGVPQGLLVIAQRLDDEQRRLLQMQFRQNFGGPSGWHSLMVLDGVLDASQARFESMGLPLGQRGLVVPDLDEINEARIAAVFGVPLSLIGTRLGYAASSYANRRSDRQEYTQETILPELERIAGTFTQGLRDEFPPQGRGAWWVEVDTTTVAALQEDENARHQRVREDLLAGVITREEARVLLGLPEQPTQDGTFYVPNNVLPTPASAVASDPYATAALGTLPDAGPDTGSEAAGTAGDTNGAAGQADANGSADAGTES
jgi:HK97 family phage portal protein